MARAGTILFNGYYTPRRPEPARAAPTRYREADLLLGLPDEIQGG